MIAHEHAIRPTRETRQHDYHVSLGFYLAAVAAVFAAAIIVHVEMRGGPLLWVMTIFGAFVLSAIISSVLPSILDKRHRGEEEYREEREEEEKRREADGGPLRDNPSGAVGSAPSRAGNGLHHAG